MQSLYRAFEGRTLTYNGYFYTFMQNVLTETSGPPSLLKNCSTPCLLKSVNIFSFSAPLETVLYSNSGNAESRSELSN